MGAAARKLEFKGPILRLERWTDVMVDTSPPMCFVLCPRILEEWCTETSKALPPNSCQFLAAMRRVEFRWLPAAAMASIIVKVQRQCVYAVAAWYGKLSVAREGVCL